MKKLKRKNGLTLVEMLCAILILTLLSVGIVTCMNSATKTYSRVLRDSDTASLTHNLDNNLSDMLRYSSNVKNCPNGYSDNTGINVSEAKMVFKNLEYCSNLAFFYLDTRSGVGKLKYVDVQDLGNMYDVVNEGTYGDTLGISDFSCVYYPEEGNQEAGCFEISYTVYSTDAPGQTLEHTCCVRQLNPQK